MKASIARSLLVVGLLFPLFGFDSCDGPPPDGPPGEGDTLSIGVGGAQPTVHVEALDEGSPRRFDPYVDAFFDGRGPVPGWAIVLERGIDDAGADEAIRLWTPAPYVGTYRIAAGALRTEHTVRDGASESSRRGAAHDGHVTITRSDTRLVGDYEVTLCADASLVDCEPVELAGHFDITRRVAGASEERELPDVEPFIPAVRIDLSTDETLVDLVVYNRGAGVSQGGTYEVRVEIEDDDPDGECDGTVALETDVDFEAIDPGRESPVVTLRIPSVPSTLNVCIHIGYDGDEEDDGDDNQNDAEVERHRPDLAVEIERVQHGSGVFVVDYILRNHGLQPLTFERGVDGSVAIDFFAHPAAPPTITTPTTEATWSINLQPILLPNGTYRGRSVFFAGDAGGTSGTLYARTSFIDRDDDVERDLDTTNDVSPGASWSGSWPGRFDNVGSRTAPIAVGTAPVGFFGMVRSESVYAINVTPGTRVHLRARGLNDPFGIVNWVPRFDLHLDPMGNQLGYSTQVGFTTDPWHELEVDVPAGVSTIYLWARVNGTSSAPLDGSSFYVEIYPGAGGDLEIDTAADATIDGSILELPYTVSNRGTIAIAAQTIPVFFFAEDEDHEMLAVPNISDTPRARYIETLVVPGGLLAAGASIDGVARLDYDDFDEALGEIYAVVNGGVIRRGCPTCLAPLIDEIDLTNNTSAASEFTPHHRDIRIESVEVSSWVSPSEVEWLIFRVYVLLAPDSDEEVSRDFGVAFSPAEGDANTRYTESRPDEPALATDRGRYVFFYRRRAQYPDGGTLRIEIDPAHEIFQGPGGRDNDVLTMPWSPPEEIDD